ncbi:50S ribosomal protein L6 [Candidatus Uhrbacteria bacterium]|nr:50S ribosomal protein L6 [Candidatus Uhrbacteria bacterium]
MSRVGKKPILIPTGVEVDIQDHTVNVKGPKGSLSTRVNAVVLPLLSDAPQGKVVVFQVDETMTDDANTRAQWGTARANVANLVQGVTEGFMKKLEVNGVGFRVNVSGRTIVLTVGFSHDVKVPLPEGVTATVEGNIITITGADKHLVGEFADRVRSIKKPEPYKGKGIKYVDEVIRRKAGKTQKAGA